MKTFFGTTTSQNISSNLTKNASVDNGSSIGQAVSVYQALQYAEEYIKSYEANYSHNIIVHFPNSSHGTSCYDPDNNAIYILDQDAFDWDVLQHEYAHVIQYVYDLNDSHGGEHNCDTNLADYYNDKEIGIKLAWGEGWPTYYAIKSQIDMGLVNRGIPRVGDTYYSDTVDSSIDYSIEAVEPEYLLGESGEVAVSGVLFDLTDPNDASDYDTIYCRFGDIWNITKNEGCTTLSELISGIYGAGYSMSAKLNVGTVLSHFKVAASLNSVSSGVWVNPPSFSWRAQGGSVLYPNNSFNLAFYDNNYNLILKTGTTTINQHTLNSAQWQTIKASSNNYVYCCVEANQVFIPYTGPYYSNIITINIP